MEIKYEDLDDLEDADSDSDVDAVRRGAASANPQRVSYLSLARLAGRTFSAGRDGGRRGRNAQVRMRLVCSECDVCYAASETALTRDAYAVRSEARPVDETADKLDGMMEIVFSHLGRCEALRGALAVVVVSH